MAAADDDHLEARFEEHDLYGISASAGSGRRGAAEGRMIRQTVPVEKRGCPRRLRFHVKHRPVEGWDRAVVPGRQLMLCQSFGSRRPKVFDAQSGWQ